MLALTLTLALAFATRAGAQTPSATDQARARDAFERGSAAYRVGDFARAATEYARADALDPNAAALRAALDAATLADDPVLGTELIERATRAPVDADSRKTLDAARARFEHRTGHVVFRCAPNVACLATIDGAAIDTSRPKIVTVGAHAIVIQSEAGLQPLIMKVAADQTIVVSAAQPPPPAPITPPPAPAPVTMPPASAHAGLHPAFFFAALGTTVVAGGISVWSAFDTRHRHTEFVNAGCNRAPSSSCDALASDGDAAQTRTNVLLAVTGALAVTTATLGVFVRWHGAHGESIAITPNGAGASLRVGF
jgi:hypothetical protein